jgi:hypothetical protein
MQPYPVAAADTLLEIGTAVISAVLSLDEHLSQCFFLWPEILLCCVVGYALLNASRTAANDFDAK